VRIALLGPLQVRDQAGEPVAIGGRQLRVLLILLALNAGRVVPAGVLAAGLWPDEQPADPGNALQTLVSRLRAALREAGWSGVIESQPAGYRLAVPADAVDALRFQALAEAGRRALGDDDPQTALRRLREALELWRGQPVADAAGYEFADAAALRLAEQRDAAIQDRIEAELALGEAASAVGELRAMVSANPLAERPRALLMRALSAAGRQAEALAEYTQARELLADRLGMDPSPALEQVYLRILRGEEIWTERTEVHPHGPLPPCPVPAPLTSFVGRDDEMARLLKLLRDSARLVTLTGPGGVGKTRLASEVPARLDSSARFVPLAPVTDPVEVPYVVLDALGMRQPTIGRLAGEAGAAGDPVDRLAAALADRDDVLILDNCEHVIDAAATLAARLLAACPRLRIVATSREPLRTEGETLCPVPPLGFPVMAADAESYAAFPSVRLFCDRTAAVVPGFALDTDNAQAVAQVCRALDGIPLAIELAAVWLRVLTPAQLAERLDDRFALLTGGSRTALPRHQTLRAVVDWSWELLSEPERVLARRLSVFPAGATLAAAERVCAGGPLPAAGVLAGLSGLVEKSILAAGQSQDAGTGARYRMLETVRAYCLERLSTAEETRQVRDAFSAYYLDLTETADPRLRGREQRRWLRELIAEQDNIYAALRWAIARRDAGTALRFMRALGWFWMLRGQSGEPVTLAREVLALGPGPSTLPMAEARVICALMAAGPAWELDQVRGKLSEALNALAQWPDQWRSYHPIAILAEPLVSLLDGDTERAAAVLEKYAAAPDPWVRAGTGMLRASFATILGQTADAEDDLRAVLAAFRELGDAWGAAGTMLHLAQFDQLRGNYPAAVGALEEAVAIGRDLGAWGDLSQIEGKLASVRLRMGDLDRAREDLERAERAVAGLAADRTDATVWLAQVRAELCWREGDRDAAERLYLNVLSSLDGLAPLWWQTVRAQVLTRLAMLALEAGDRARCRTLLADALRAGTAWIDPAGLTEVMDATAAFVVHDDPGLAAALLGAAHTVRGAFDESSLDAPGARQAARDALGLPGFETAYQHGRELSSADGLALADQVFRR